MAHSFPYLHFMSTKKNPGKKKVVSRSYPALEYVWWIPLLIIFILVLYIRLKHLNMPLERDEGEYGLMAQQLLRGHLPYSLSYNMKLPGVSFIYALFIGIIGSKAMAIRAGLLITNILSAFLLYQVGNKLFNQRLAIISSSIFLIMSVSPNVLGFAAHATHYIVLFFLLGFWILIKEEKQFSVKALPLSGICFGIAFLMKQSAFFFILFGISAVMLLSSKQKSNIRKSLQNTALFVSGSTIPYVLLAIGILLFGNFQNFWFWTVEYLYKYGSVLGISDAPNVFSIQFKFVRDGFELIWMFALLGLILLFIPKKSDAPKYQLLALFIFSVLAVSMGFYFRRHYFIQLLPIISLLSAFTIERIIQLFSTFNKKNFGIGFGFGLFIAILVFGIRHQSDLLTLKSQDLVNTIYGGNPFIESEAIGKHIKSITEKEDKVLVFGSEPEINFYAQRQSPTGFIYTYSLMESHDLALQMQEDYISEVEANPPEIIVGVKNDLSWLQNPRSNTNILTWFDQFLKKYNYQVIASAQRNNRQLEYFFEDQIANYRPQGDKFLLIYKKP